MTGTATMRFGLPGGRGTLGAGGSSSNQEAIRTAERLGFDSVWFTDEPALADDATTWRTRRSALVLATAAAAVTERIRLGVAVTPAQLGNPLRLAADLATLDVLTGGRLTLVVGSAATGLDQVLACWTGAPVTVDGQAHVVDPVPVQRPRPPVFVATAEDTAIEWAARRGHGLILPADLPTAAVAGGLARYTDHGGDPDAARVERFCFVGESDLLAWQTGGPSLAELVAYLQATAPGLHGFPAASLTEDTIIVGGPSTVAERIAHLREVSGVHAVNVRPSLRGHCPFALQRVTVDLFAAEVVPLLQGDPVRSERA